MKTKMSAVKTSDAKRIFTREQMEAIKELRGIYPASNGKALKELITPSISAEQLQTIIKVINDTRLNFSGVVRKDISKMPWDELFDPALSPERISLLAKSFIQGSGHRDDIAFVKKLDVSEMTPETAEDLFDALLEVADKGFSLKEIYEPGMDALAVANKVTQTVINDLGLSYKPEDFDEEQVYTIISWYHALKDNDMRHKIFDPKWEPEIMDALCRGCSYKVDLIPYAEDGFNADQLSEILNGINNRINVNFYLDTRYTGKQMAQLRLGLASIGEEKTKLYADPAYDDQHMELIRKILTANLCNKRELQKFLNPAANIIILESEYERLTAEKKMRDMEESLYLRGIARAGGVTNSNVTGILSSIPSNEEYDKEFEELIREDVEGTPTVKPEGETALRIKMRNWIEKTSFKEFYSAISERVIGQPELKIVLAAIYNYIDCMAHKRKHKSNCIIAAPSGCGKTETFRAVQDYFEKKIPEFIVYQYDMNGLTTEGFKGQDTASVISPLLASPYNGLGIGFLDEFDKKILPSYDGKGTNVNREVQNQILTLIEGRVFSTVPKGSTVPSYVNTENTMFIALGSFNDFREKREFKPKVLGFNTVEDTEEVSHYAPVDRNNIIQTGSSYELLGRFPHLVNFGPLSREAVFRVIEKMRKEAEDSVGCKVALSQEFIEELCKEANGEFGCRALGNTITSTVFDGYIKALEDGMDLSRIVINVISKDDTTYEMAYEDEDIER